MWNQKHSKRKASLQSRSEEGEMEKKKKQK